MLNTFQIYSLTDLETGEPFEIHVAPMTLSMKSNLDEWIRGMYLRRMTEMGDVTPEIQQVAENLDILGNNFFLSKMKAAPRILWELCRPKMAFKIFEKRFFDVSIWDVSAEESLVKTWFEQNANVFSEALEYATRNPTKKSPPETPPVEVPTVESTSAN